MRRLIILTLLALSLAGVVMWVVLADKTEKVLPPEARYSERFRDVEPRARAGAPQAQYDLATLYYTGKGTKKDLARALMWYRRAAEQSHPAAQYSLGWMHEHGEGTRLDPTIAAKWYRVAATAGRLPQAQFALGELYFNGRGVPHDYGVAIEWYERAAAAGHPVAQSLLGNILAEGWGVKKDLVRAHAWLTLAEPQRAAVVAANRKLDPVETLERIESEMNRQQLVEAARMMRKLLKRK